MGRRMPAAVAVAFAVVLSGCGAGLQPPDGGATASTIAGSSVRDSDPNASGRLLAASTGASTGSTSAEPGAGGAAGGGAAICANETLAESMARAVQAGSSVVLADGGFTGMVGTGDGEIGVPFSEVALTVQETLAGAEVGSALAAWVSGDLSGRGAASSTGETSSLWARGGAMIAVVDADSQWSGLPGPIVRVAPVIGDDVIVSWVGCWTTNGVESREFTGAVDLFDDRGLHPTEIQLSAVRLEDFRAQLPG